MKLAFVRRPIEAIMEKRSLDLPGPIIWSTMDFEKREAVYLIETDQGVEVPEVDAWETTL